MSAVPCSGFADPVHDAQRSFRAVLDALARPGTVHPAGVPIAGLPIGPAMAHVLLALTDEDTAVWWQQPDAQLVQWLRFHTGARAAADAAGAAFAVLPEAAAMPPLDAFNQGSPAAPEFSTTLLVEVPSFTAGEALQWHGPGIAASRAVRIAGLAPGFWAQWQANHARFPQGVDVLFTCGAQILGLPRTTRISRLEGV